MGTMRTLIREEIHEEIQPIRLGLNVVLETVQDPWENIRSVGTEIIMKESAEKLDPVSIFYGTKKKKYCMMLGSVSHCNIVCAHIWPKLTAGRGLEHYGLSAADVNSPRNFLRLHIDIEKAFDEKRLYFEKIDLKPNTISLCLRVLDPALLRETFSVTGLNRTFASIDNQQFKHEFVGGIRPFLRILAVHANKAIYKAKSFGWIVDNDFVLRHEKNIEMARYLLGSDSVIMNTFFHK